MIRQSHRGGITSRIRPLIRIIRTFIQMTALVKLSNSSFWGFMFVCVLCFFACFGFCCCFCLFDFSSSPITIYRSYNTFGRRSVDDRKAINFLIIEEKKNGKIFKNLISHENDVQIWRSYYALVFKSIEPIYRHSKWKIQWLKPVAMVTNGST